MRKDRRASSFSSRTIATAFAMAAASAASLAAVIAFQDPGPGRPGGRGPGGLSGIAIFMALDKDGAPGLSAAEIDGAPAVLRALDKNADGLLTADELPAFGRGGRGDFAGRGDGRRGRGGQGDEPGEASPTSADDLTSTLMAFDRNNDGKLTRAEVPERFQGLFDRADANKDGELTATELKQSAAAQPQPSAGRGRGDDEDGRGGREGRRGGPFGGADPLTGALDLDGDGRLSTSELASAPGVLRRFDRNADGVVALDEIFMGFGRGRG